MSETNDCMKNPIDEIETLLGCTLEDQLIGRSFRFTDDSFKHAKNIRVVCFIKGDLGFEYDRWLTLNGKAKYVGVDGFRISPKTLFNALLAGKIRASKDTEKLMMRWTGRQ